MHPGHVERGVSGRKMKRGDHAEDAQGDPIAESIWGKTDGMLIGIGNTAGQRLRVQRCVR
jgi:hypothetical protein